MTDDKNPRAGYCNPPKANQFKPGLSGNPKGRPKGAKNKSLFEFGKQKFSQMWLDEAEKLITIKGQNGYENVTSIAAVFQALKLKALKGNVQAQKFFISITKAAEDEKFQEFTDPIDAALRFKEYWGPIYDQRDINEFEGRYIGPPPTAIRPDEIIIDEETGDVSYIKQPSLSEQVFIEKIEKQKAQCSKRATRTLNRIIHTKDTQRKEKYRRIFEMRKKEHARLCLKVAGPTPDENGKVDAFYLLELSPAQLKAHENLLVMKKSSEQEVIDLIDLISEEPEAKISIMEEIEEVKDRLNMYNAALAFRALG